MGAAGNSQASDERRRFEVALTGRNVDRVLERARDLPVLTLKDAFLITSLLVETGDDRAERAQVKLMGRILVDRGSDIEGADLVFTLVTNMGDEKARIELAGFCS